MTSTDRPTERLATQTGPGTGDTRPVPAHDPGRTDPVTTTGPAHDTTGDSRRRASRPDGVGGIKWGAAFFGWLTAVGAAVLLTGIVAAIAGGTGLTPDAAADGVAAATGTALPGGVLGAVLVAVVLFLAYYCGGYVAGRMARFSGARQGVAVWVWAVVVAVVVAVLVTVGGRRIDLTAAASLGGLPADPSTLTLAGGVAVAVALLVGLAGAVLGGLAGMRFHRRIDRRIDSA